MLLKCLKKAEGRFRVLLICFCAYSFLHIIVNGVISDFTNINPKSPMTIVIMIVLSIAIGIFIKWELLEFFGGEEWSWKPKNAVEKVQNEFFCIVGIGCLYYFSQVGAMIIFFPGFENLMIHSFKLYNLLFLSISLFIYILYRLTILKFE